jgi:hypothetical protein
MSSQQAAQLVEFPVSRYLSNLSALAEAAFFDAIACVRSGETAADAAYSY